MLSEKVLFAINDLDSGYVEETGLRMGYIRKHMARSTRRVVLIAAIVAALLALSVTAYAIGRSWSKSMQERLKASAQQEQELEDAGMATVFSGEEDYDFMAVTCNGVTIRPLELITDEYNVRLSFKIEGFEFDSEFEPCFIRPDLYIGDEPDSGRLNGGGGFWWEPGEDGKPVFTDVDGNLEFTFEMQGNYPDRPILGQTLHVVFDGMGTVRKTAKTQTLEGEWRFEFELPEESPAKLYTVDTPIEGTALSLGTVKLSPLSGILECPVIGAGEPAEIIDSMPMVLHFVLKDGTVLEYVAGGGSRGYTDDSCAVAYNSFALWQVVDPEQVAALILTHESDKSKTITIPIQ